MAENFNKQPQGAPPMATFKKANEELPKLDSYEGEFPEEFWEAFTKYELPKTHESWINVEELEKEARASGYKSVKLDVTVDNLRNGVNIGVETEEARMETDRGRNYDSVYLYGEEFTDTLQSWVKDKIVSGPYTREQLREMGFTNIKVIPVQVRRKPNGKLR